MKKTGKTLITLATLAFLGLGALSFGLKQNAIGANAADHLDNNYSFTGTGELGTKNLDSNWSITGEKGTAGTAPTLYTTELRVYSVRQTGLGNILTIRPTALNTDKVLTKITFNATAVAAIKVMVGTTEAGMTEVTSQAFSSNAYTYTNLSGFSYFSLTNAHTGGSNNLQIKLTSVVFDYKDVVYDDVESIESNLASPQEVFVGDSFVFAPTILPETANQNFTVSSESSALTISGSSIIANEPASNVEVTLTTVGKNSLDQSLTDVVTFNFAYRTTTVAEALTLPTSTSLYLVEDAKISVADPANNRQVTLIDLVDLSKTILIYGYDWLSPSNGYRYIKDGLITFTATIGSFNDVNQFTNPTVLSYTDEVEEFADSILFGDTADQCLTRFADYKVQVLAFIPEELAKLQNSTDANIVAAKARYEAWAAHLGEDPYTGGSSGSLAETTSNNNSLPFAIIVSILGLTVVAGFYLQRSKRKEEND